MQTQEYKDSVFLRQMKKRLSVEAGVSMGWEKYVREKGGDHQR